MRTRSRLFAAVALVSLGSVSALAIDASCVGVQAVATRQLVGQLSAAEQARLDPIVQQVNALEQRLAPLIAGPENGLREIFDGIRQRMPAGSTPAEIQREYYNEILTSPTTDAATVRAFAAQLDAHDLEVLIIALASRVPRPQQRERLESLVRSYAVRLPAETSAALRGSRPLQDLYTVVAAGETMRNMSPLDPRSQVLASDVSRESLVPALGQFGWDSGTLGADSGESAVRALPQVMPAVHAVGSGGLLIVDHIVGEGPPAEVRRRITAPGATQTGRTMDRHVALGLNRSAVAGEAMRIVSRSVPREPPPPPERVRERRTWVRQAAQQMQQATQVIIQMMPGEVRAAVGLTGGGQPRGTSPAEDGSEAR